MYGKSSAAHRNSQNVFGRRRESNIESCPSVVPATFAAFWACTCICVVPTASGSLFRRRPREAVIVRKWVGGAFVKPPSRGCVFFEIRESERRSKRGCSFGHVGTRVCSAYLPETVVLCHG